MNKKEVQTMKRILSIAAVACALMLGGSDARADNTGGLCNSIIGNVLGTAQQFVDGVGDPVQQCSDVGAALTEFEETPGCFDALLAGEVQGLTGPAVFYSHDQKAGASTSRREARPAWRAADAASCRSRRRVSALAPHAHEDVSTPHPCKPPRMAHR